jgi:gliding motility-associated-like protein
VKNIFFILFLLWQYGLQAQICRDNYFATTYTGSSPVSLAQAISNDKNEMVCVGSIQYEKGSQILSDGWVSKYSENGTVLWSKRYTMPPYLFLQLRDVVQSSDDTYMAVGQVSDTLLGQDSKMPETRGVLLHIDKHGNLIKSQILQAEDVTEAQTFFLSIAKAAETGFIISGTTGFKAGLGDTRGFYMRVDLEGRQQWLTRFSSGSFSFPNVFRNAILQADGNKLISGVPVGVYTPVDLKLIKTGYYLFCLDLVTGQRIWDRSFTCPESLNGFFDAGAITHISQLANGDLSFQGFYNDSSLFSAPPLYRKSIQIITGSTGNLKAVQAFYNEKPGSRTVAGYTDGVNNKVLLVDDGQKALLVESDATGTLKALKAFSGMQDGMRAAALIRANDGGNYIFAANRARQNSIHLLKTDAKLVLDCAATPAALVTEDAKENFEVYESNTQAITSGSTQFPLPFVPMFSADYLLQAQVDCQKTCCKNTTDTASALTLCDVVSYQLPDRTVVSYSGTYYVNYKTISGCDSVVFYPVNFSKTPSANLGPDNCLGENDSLVLRAASGYETYNWMGRNTIDSMFTIRQPGVYWVAVSNRCGTNRDSIQIYKECTVPVYMPTAFTPNGDGHNDVFGFPTQNKASLVQLTIYNRWGEVVFYSDNSNRKWDGSYKSKLQPSGTYVYSLVTKTLNGKRLTSHGTVMLIR